MASTSGSANAPRRSGRTVRAPKRDLGNTGTTEAGSSQPSVSSPAKPRKPKAAKFESDEAYVEDLLTNPKSPLTTMDILVSRSWHW
jgi:hypothetical protein